jgi:cephalosporin-C deacetylase-like acetyl esterase
MVTIRFRCLLSVMFAALTLSCDRPANAADDVLPGTQRLELNEPLDVAMVRGISEFAEQEIALSRDRREALWHRDYSSPEAYEKSIAPNRERLKVSLGVIDERVSTSGLSPYGWGHSAEAKPGTLFHQRLDVLEGVTVESVTLASGGQASLIYIPDADHAPEEVTGHLPGVELSQRIPSRLYSEMGIGSVIPVLISRSDENSGTKSVRFTNQTQREFIYRNSFELGRHLIGYEVQKILALIDALGTPTDPTGNKVPLVVWGHGEGGQLALHAAAVDPRIDVCVVSGYFEERENVWREPIYRNVWRQLSEFGDAEVASLIAPRQLIIEACAGPNIDGPPAPRPGRSGGAAPGVLRTPPIESVEREFARAKTHYEKLKAAGKIHLIKSGDGTGPVGASKTLALVKHALSPTPPASVRSEDPDENTTHRQYMAVRQKRQCEELRQYNQRLMHVSDKYRDKIWAGADRSSLAKWQETQEAYRTKVYDELIGRIPYDLLPPNARTRKIIDEPTHTGYEVVLDVWGKGGETHRTAKGQGQSDKGQKSSTPQPSTLNSQPFSSVFAGGILLVPKDLEPGEKRPVVVCQHGLEGIPNDTISEDPKHEAYHYYKGFSSVLVKRGFIVYAPQNPYRGQDNFRVLQRKSNPLGRSLFSYIVPQHQQTLNWLATLPFVDADRIAFYGLSYGGKTAVRVPPMLPGGKGEAGYCLSICSADFDEWVLKIVTTEDRYSYMFTGEYEIFEWNMAHIANYAELSSLMTPRPFMVERGHEDGVAPDEWVGWEYYKVKRYYDKLGIGDRTEIEVFDGPHTINGNGTYKFLHKHLNWPEPAK